jgi:hypothetical protein
MWRAPRPVILDRARREVIQNPFFGVLSTALKMDSGLRQNDVLPGWRTARLHRPLNRHSGPRTARGDPESIFPRRAVDGVQKWILACARMT